MKTAILGVILLAAITSLAAQNANVNLFWDANSEPDVTFYRIHQAAATGGPYTEVGTAPQTINPMFTHSGVDLTTSKFYVVTAVNAAGNESPFSNEVEAKLPAGSGTPAAPTVTITITVSP